MARYKTRLYYKNLVTNIINWLNSDIDEWTANDLFNDPKVEIKNAIADNSRDLKEKIDLYLEGQDEF
tara:strand:+ start:360 stop:560 length:201 start_codon:yes stop_codon:yes gene_type:complete